MSSEEKLAELAVASRGPHRARAEAAFEELIGHLAPRVERFGKGRRLSAGEVEELLLDFHVKLWRSIGTYDQGRPFSRWIVPVIRTTYNDLVARRARGRGRDPAGPDGFELTAAPDNGARGLSGVDQEMLARVLPAIAALSDLELIILRAWLFSTPTGWTMQAARDLEAASLEPIAAGTLRVRIRRILEKIRSRLRRESVP